MKFKRIEAAILCAVFLAAMMSIANFSSACSQIRESVLRLHVLANSDSEADQELKLQVRDAVLAEGAHIFDGSLTVEQAESAIAQSLPQLERAARDEIKARGYSYDVHVTLSEEFFETRTYDNNITLPAGRYRAVRVIIGAGEGHNWWCIMFPPLCLPAAQSNADLSDMLSEREERVVHSSPKYEPRFKIVEWIERLREALRNEPEQETTTDYFTVTQLAAQAEKQRSNAF